jgi:hypothetical protein
MPEGNINAEVAEHLREHGAHGGHDEQAAHKPSRRRIETIEILEAILLAIVAVATALSGYQAALWDGESAKEYATSSRLRTEGQSTALTANQTLIYNAGNFTAWLQAYDAGDESLQKLLERRFTPEYKAAFDAWVAIDGMNDPSAPPGPRYMEEYEDPLTEKAAEQNKEASHAFDLGVEYRKTGERYVRVTVILAAVLFLIAIGQRFQIRGVRYAVNVVAGILLVYAMFLFFIYPHLWGGA